jgi:hypothetical protein
MSHEEVAAWLHAALAELPRVTAQPQPLGGVKYHTGDIELGHVQPCGLACLDAEPHVASLVVRSGWAAPDRHGVPGRLTIDLSQPQGGTVALWLLVRNYRVAGTTPSTDASPAPGPDGSTAGVSFDTRGTPPSIRLLGQVGTGSLSSS